MLTTPRKLYRLEWLAVAALATWLMIATVDWSRPWHIALVIGFAVMPDLALLALPAGERGARWPFAFYNLLHTLTTWAAAAVVATLAGWDAGWTLLAWLIHIAVDRAVGFALRDAHGDIPMV